MSAELALILTKWTRNYCIVFLLIAFGNGKENCMQKGAGPMDLYKNGAMNVRYQWARVGHKIQVPVVLDPKYSYRERGIILGGLGEIQKKTCVNFYVFNHTGALSGYDYVYITKSKEGCWSHVGRVGGGQQELSLARGCINHRTAVHEMIHALGFTHEHVRNDRDDYVRINWGNIMPGRERNFVKRDTKGRDPYGPYDYGSIMHYDKRAFSLNGEDTIRPLKQHGDNIGKGQTMSYWDTKRILHMYKCGDGYGSGYSDGSNHLDYDDGENHEQNTQDHPVDRNQNKRHPQNHQHDDEDYFQNLHHPQDFGPQQNQPSGQQHNPTASRNHQNQNRIPFHLPDDYEDFRDQDNPPRHHESHHNQRHPTHNAGNYEHRHPTDHIENYQNQRHPPNNQGNYENQLHPSGHPGNQQTPFFEQANFNYDYQQRHPQTHRGTSTSLEDSPLYGSGNNLGNAQEYGNGLNFLGQNYDYRF